MTELVKAASMVIAAAMLYMTAGRMTAVWYAGTNDVIRCEFVKSRSSDGSTYVGNYCYGTWPTITGIAWPVFLPLKVSIIIGDKIVESITQ